MPLVTPLPTPPNSSDTTNFNTRADAFLGALPTLATEVNSVGTNMETQYNYVAANMSTTAANASQATTAANTAVSAKNSIEVLFLGSKTSNPTTNNSGGSLVVGCKYFNTTVGEDRVWTGTNWVASTALGGTVASLSVDGVLKLKKDTWHTDSENYSRLHFGGISSGGGITYLRGYSFNFLNDAYNVQFSINNSSDVAAYGRASLNSAGSFLAAHSVTVGGSNGGGNTVGMGLTSGGIGALGQIGADANHLFIGPNTYYEAGNDRFSINGYAPKIRMFTSDNTILFQQTDNGIAGNGQSLHNVANFTTGGAFEVRSRNGYGFVNLAGGGPTNAGLVQFYRPSGERTGYIGYAGDTAGSINTIVADTSHPWQFEVMPPRSGIDATLGSELPRLSQFASSQSTNGYTKLPNGLIIQWGTTQITSGSAPNITLPISFPNSNFCVNVSGTITGGDGYNVVASNKTLSTIQILNGSNSTQFVYWMVIGR